MTKIFRGYFITGLLVVVPLYFSIYVLTIIVGFMDSILNLLPRIAHPDTYLPIHIPGLGIIFTVFSIFLVGVFTTNLLGKRLLAVAEKIMSKVPVVRMVYNATKQFMETFFTKGAQGFRKVVLIEFPRKGIYSMGFMTSRISGGELREKTSVPSVCVFVPTTPNPTSGYFAVVPETDIIALDMKVEDAFKVIMTGGMVIPNNDDFKLYVKNPAHGDLVGK
ncbi:MAG TPA: hypothetical protein DDW94_08825 [Deltaproteobacteria bacterium]|nr:MAG: hypothetical protein A2Z79_03335 [Deltaproteobacteria bacterium GWA2_55_82]OGQ62313.1 MAG: hypothetical protein A3I81_05245 [Deltaproteobacteria bacterium RIFCSPLOWO2_02_FULL_55_12]OIJ74425.1 MAG: hypothetical protein A2V21_309235 [Deltaproteobacteria bacterium GWC2_55_46]HBG47078.1 hypothetical protein [Deltaproteobacteria bacterium]HCY10863.1 hypothetical protein [Deltaproteobacteria bacterium]